MQIGAAFRPNKSHATLIYWVVSRVEELYPGPGADAPFRDLEALHAGIHHLVRVRWVQQPVRVVVTSS